MLGRKIADVTMFEDDPASSGVDFMNHWLRAAVVGALPALLPLAHCAARRQSDRPGRQAVARRHRREQRARTDAGCHSAIPFAQLFCFFTENFAQYVPPYPARDYVAPVFAFNTTEAGLGEQFGLLGFADDNWVDGTQSLVFAFDADVYRETGYGFTGTIIHEVGHHIGMSHPHDGFDPETGVDFGADGEFFFAWAGDESETVMHYLTLSNRSASTIATTCTAGKRRAT